MFDKATQSLLCTFNSLLSRITGLECWFSYLHVT